MPGFQSEDAFLNATTNINPPFRSDFNKSFNPTAAAVANEVHTLFRGGGMPAADALFDTGANLTFIPVKDTTTNAGCIQHGGNVQSTYYKFLANSSAVTAAATTAPGTLILVDVIGYYRVTSVTTATAQATTNTLGQSDTFSADDTTDICTYTSTASVPSNILTGTRVRLTTTTTLPAGLALATDYYVIRLSDTTFKLATTYANAIAGTAINITSTGTGTHTISWLLPRYTNGAGVKAIFFNPAATAMGAATPSLSLGYTNSAQATGRATPTVLPVGKTAASNSHILYTGATGAGKYQFQFPMQNGDAGIAEINTIQNSVSYVSGTYTVALYREITRFYIPTLGVGVERNHRFDLPGMPRIYDTAALYGLWQSGVATPVNSNIGGHLDFVWN